MITREEWFAKGKKIHGHDNEKEWRFVCPACGHIAKIQDWIDVGAPNAAAFSCIGRYINGSSDFFEGKGSPCNYAGGGLIRLNPVHVEGIGYYFEFADLKEEVSNDQTN